MTRRPSVGPILAIAGAVIALAAIIAGFVLVGGPGDVRDRRLDEMTDENVMAVLDVVQCAFNGTGVTPASYDDAARSDGWRDDPENKSPCIHWRGKDLDVPTGGDPTRPGEVTYEALSPTRIRVCAFYRAPDKARDCAGCYKENTYESVFAARPAGLHCHDIDMVAQPTLENYPAAHGVEAFSVMH